MAKHRAPRYVRTRKALAGVPVAAGATVIGLGVLSSPAQAAGSHDWTGVAQCESGGKWNTNTGNGYFGGLQFGQSTWAGYGGTAFAPRADQASPAQQVEVAEKVLAAQGVGAWPTCGKYLTGGTTAAAAVKAAPVAPKPKPAAAAPKQKTTAAAKAKAAPAAAGTDTYGRHAAPAGRYTVERGDTVATIAAAHGESWQELYRRNLAVIGGDPDVITPGQVLRMSGTGRHAAEPAAAKPAAVQRADIKRAATKPAAAKPAPVKVDALAGTSLARISNSAGNVRPMAQAAANQVIGHVPGAAGVTIGGTRASAVDPKGHPSGLALDYVVGSDTALGDAIAQYEIAHWDELGVEYIIWQQRMLSSPTGTWQAMADRGSATANHMDHVHTNYRAA
jgi:LysM repeat protein